MYSMAMLRSGGGLQRARLVGEDVRSVLTDELKQVVASSVASWAIGDPEQVRAQLMDTAEQFEVDEIMINAVQGARPGEPADQWVAKQRGLQLLADAMLS